MVGFTLHFTLERSLLLYICVDEVPAPRRLPRPTTVRQGNWGL
jgi:hypothetical protein